MPDLANIAALRAYSAASPPASLTVDGYYAAGDQGAGTFIYVSTDTSSSDNSGTIIVDSLSRRWYRQYSGAVHNSWFGAKNDRSTDDTTANQAAINWCATHAEWQTLIIDGSSLVTSSLYINRKVNLMTSEFVIRGEGPGAGFYVTTAITIFDSTLTGPPPTSPQSELVRFEDIQFEASSASTAAYCLSQNFLRVKFLGCHFYQIKCVTSSIFIQSWNFQQCYATKWTGSFVYSTGAYDIGADGCEFEAGGSGFYLLDPTGNNGNAGCRFVGNVFESGTGNFFAGSAMLGCAFIGNYFENNSLSSLQFYGGYANKGVSVIGNFISSSCANKENPSFFEIVWGPTTGAFSGGNYADGRLHDNSFPADVFIGGDYAALELYKGGATGIYDPSRSSPPGQAVALDSEVLYSSTLNSWVGLDPVFGGVALGGNLSVSQGGTLVPVRLILGPYSPGTNNSYYGNPYWTVGSRVSQQAPVVGQPKGWVCTVSGHPGTWVSEGNL